LPIRGERTKSTFPVLCDDEKALYVQVDPEKAAAELFVPGISMLDSTAAVRQFSMTGPGIYAFRHI
jgi:hypothetical protein